MKRWAKLCAVGVLIALLLKLTTPLTTDERPFFWNRTASLPLGLYVRVPDFLHDSVQRGDYVVYEPSPETVSVGVERGWMHEDTIFLKKVGALAGDRYDVSPDLQFTIEGEPCGIVYLEDSHGRPMPLHIGSYTVPEEMFLPVGTAPKSFDGRYTGPVPVENIKGVVLPFLTGIHY